MSVLTIITFALEFIAGCLLIAVYRNFRQARTRGRSTEEILEEMKRDDL
ncbi:hypothetical protein [Actinomadura rubrisoli]|nr:hypothetical protein [Actinomadura rubrisoli]